MTAAAILAMPTPVAAPSGGLSAAAPGAEGESAFARLVGAEAPAAESEDQPQPKEAPRDVSLASSAARSPSLPHPVLLPTDIEDADATPVAGTGLRPDLALPEQDLGEGRVAPPVEPAPVSASEASESQTPAAIVLPVLFLASPAAHALRDVADEASATPGFAPSPDTAAEQLAPEAESDAANAQADTDASALQAAAAQALAADRLAVRGQPRSAELAALKDAPANASGAKASDDWDPASSVDALAAPTPATDAAPRKLPPQTAPGLKAEPVPQASPAHAETSTAQTVDASAPSPAPAPASAPAPVQTASVLLTQASHLAQATVETTVQIAAQITRKLEGRSTRFEMGLTPEGLGRVDISLDIDSGGKLTARLAFDNPLAATEMRGKADELRRELQDAGFTIANDGLEFSERQSSPHDGFDRRQGRAFAGASRINAEADLTQPAPAWVSLSLTPRGVDMKV